MGEPESIFQIHILRFNPETDRQPHWESYPVPHVKTMTVMEALENLWDQGEYIAFRSNCKEFTCGSCSMIINGKPRLACDTLLEDGMKLEPLTRYPVIRDLVVDTGRVNEKLAEMKYWPVTDEASEELVVTPKVREAFDSIYTRCIECYCCLDACVASSSPESEFDGPMYTLLLARAKHHPLDEMDRVKQASERGIWSCVSCLECVNVCPVNLKPATEVRKFRRDAVKESVIKRFFGRRKEAEP
jgi:succinate dehydrogenase/fumarate reductase iron-sulfur protein